MTDDYMHNRIMQIQRGRVAMGAGKAHRKAAKGNPWLHFVKMYRAECKRKGLVCDLKDAAVRYHKRNPHVNSQIQRKVQRSRASSKTAKRASSKGKVCRKYTPRKCKVKYVSGSKKNRCKKFTARKCKKFGRGGVLLGDEMYGGCGECPNCGYEMEMDY